MTRPIGRKSFVDACANGTSVGKVSSSSQTMPFAFLFHDAGSTAVEFTKRGMITFGGASGTTSGENLVLPDSGAPGPAVYAFWDDIDFGGANSTMCYQTIGSAPNRKYVIEWKDMDFVDAADGVASLTFEAILSEGTNNIDVVYDTMTGPTSRADGDSATVGVQNATGTVSTSEIDTPDFGSGNAYAFVPQP